MGGVYEGGDVAYGQRLKARLPAKRVPEAIERWIRFYESERSDGEEFNAFVERVGTQQFEARVKDLAMPIEFTHVPGKPANGSFFYDFAETATKLSLIEDAGFHRLVVDDPAGLLTNMDIAAQTLERTASLEVVLTHWAGVIEPTVAARQLAALDVKSGGRLSLRMLSEPLEDSDAEARPDCHSAVWQRSDEAEVQLTDATYAEFRARYDGLWGQGWRLKALSNTVVNGETRYNATWHPSNDGEVQLYEATFQDYSARYNELWDQGWRLKLLDTTVRDGQLRYTAVWQPSNDGETAVYGWKFQDFKNKYDADFTVEPAGKAKKKLDYVTRVLKEERDIEIASPAMVTKRFSRSIRSSPTSITGSVEGPVLRNAARRRASSSSPLNGFVT